MEHYIATLYGATLAQGDTPILSGVNLTLFRGEFTYLIGKTGSGKSTLLKTLYGAIPLAKGQGQVAGFDLQQLNRKKIPLLRRKLGMVFQDFMLLTDRTVAENLRFVLQATDWRNSQKMEARIREVLAQVQLPDAYHRMPWELSGGEQQRVAIARALLNYPELLIADEPTGNLDAETSREILRLMRHLSQQYNTAVLFATHDQLVMDAFPARVLACNGQQLEERSN